MDKNSMKLILAIDVGGTFTKLGLVSIEGEIISGRLFKTGARQPFNEFKKKLSEEIEQLRTTTTKTYTIQGVGIGAPNANYKTGEMINPPNFSWGQRVPVKKMVQQLLNFPVYMTNDANAAALGELYFGAGKNMKNFVVLTLGTGLGSGIINEGRLIYGQHGMAGELGHVNVFSEGRQCNCGLKGCLETYASVTGIKRTVYELFADSNAESLLRSVSYEDLTGKNISEAANEGDIIALKAFEYTAQILGGKMADTVAHLEPEAFILTGGLSQAGDLFLKPLKKYMEAALFNTYKNKVEIVLSKSTSTEAVLGPAALALVGLKLK
ncbi:ROK family protein [Aurantibacter crassamenti]|uniref:ROK family protein n=1 Tax=Aurantibacter crassamenti TaxID=1837375 RepID=UPI00193986E8|nr:ROK family protein [Aurantibacter crassamenti]MBM1106582.1 ROK family protein [Aurantibacter crassamenti]